MKKMSKKMIEKIKNILLNQKKELQTKSYSNDIDIDGDETDEIQGKLIAIVNSKLSLRDKEKLRNIENALKKIDDETFGLCEECGELIAEKRLEINPSFSMCISCSEEAELNLKKNSK